MARITRLTLSENFDVWPPPESFICIIFGVLVVLAMVSMTVLLCAGHGGSDQKRRSRHDQARSVKGGGGGTEQKKERQSKHRDAWFGAGGVGAGIAVAGGAVVVAKATAGGCGGCGGGCSVGCGGGCGG